MFIFFNLLVLLLSLFSKLAEGNLIPTTNYLRALIVLFEGCKKMGKRGKSQKKVDGKPNKRKLRDDNGVIEDDMDDEIDACMLINSMIFFNCTFLW